MKYGIVIFPSKEIQDFANSLRKRYDPRYSLIPPHITLKQPFYDSHISINHLAKQLYHLAKNFDPFSLKVIKFSSFKPITNIIYLKVELTKEIQQLHDEIHALLNEHPDDYTFVPHITVAQNLTDSEHSDVYGTLRMQKISFDETVDRFHLLYELENGSWTVYETFRLGKD